MSAGRKGKSTGGRAPSAKGRKILSRESFLVARTIVDTAGVCCDGLGAINQCFAI